jgi:hypothetical protein
MARTAGDSATPGVQKTFISSASELMEESSSRQRRALLDCGLGSVRAAWAWILSKRRIHSGRARMAA